MRKVWKHVRVEDDITKLPEALQAIEDKMGGMVFAILDASHTEDRRGHFGGKRTAWDVIYYVEEQSE